MAEPDAPARHAPAARPRPARSLGRAFGVLSAALGVAPVVAPRPVARLIGARPRATTDTVLRAVGARELAAAGGLLAGIAPATLLGARVAGDVMDLALLARTIPRRGSRRDRALATTAVVGVITVADLVAVSAAIAARRRARAATPPAVAAITVNRPPADVERAWRAKGGQGVTSGAPVTFAPAPGERGTELVVSIEETGGKAGKVLGTDALQQAHDELRRFKQLVETGEIARSDALPEGARTADLLAQGPARPLGGRNGAHR